MNRVPPTRRLSMGTTFHKRVFPAILIFCAVVGAIVGVLLVRNDPQFVAAGLLFVAVAIGFCYFRNRHFSWDLADEVLDGGDYLRVRRGRVQEDISLSDIERVSESLFQKEPPRIELVVTSEKFGRVISFIPAGYSLVPFGPLVRSWVFDDLSRRVEIARRMKLGMDSK